MLLVIAAAWFLFLSLSSVEGDPATILTVLMQRLAFGLAILTVALIDWSSFRGFLGIE